MYCRFLAHTVKFQQYYFVYNENSILLLWVLDMHPSSNGEVRKWTKGGHYTVPNKTMEDSFNNDCQAGQEKQFAEHCLTALGDLAEVFRQILPSLSKGEKLKKLATTFCVAQQRLNKCNVGRIPTDSCVRAQHRSLNLVKVAKRLGRLMDHEGFWRSAGSYACNFDGIRGYDLAF